MKNLIENDRYASAIRAVTCQMFAARGDGHIGGSFSIIETMAVLFNHYLRDEPKDWFVLSKGHAGPAYYSALYLTHKIKRKDICTLNANGTILPSHPDRNLTPGVDCSTGSLGQGISQAVGLAYACMIKKTESWVYCIIGDGELNEGETYEALEFASNKKLHNLIIFVDNNKKQVDGEVSKVSCNYDYIDLFKGLDLNAEFVDGKNTDEIDNAINKIHRSNDGVSHIVILDTLKGQGIKYFEQQDNCHHMTFNQEEIEILNRYVNENIGAIEDVLENTK